MYCGSCGRHQEDTCHCLYQKPISKLESILMLLILTLSPILVFTKAFQSGVLIFREYLILGSIIFSVILIVISLMTFILKKSYLALLFGCHQKSHRTIHIFKKPLNICSRCTGIYLGVWFSVGYFMIDIPVFLVFILGLPLIIDGLLQRFMSTYESTNIKRLLSGILFGPLMMFFYVGYHYVLVKLVFFVINSIN